MPTGSFGETTQSSQSIDEILDVLDPELVDIGARIEANEFAPAIEILKQRIRTIEKASSRYDES
ncbi:MAG: hypothetical protein ACE1ZA_02800, partial [Pseudomonadales bacterium]